MAVNQRKKLDIRFVVIGIAIFVMVLILLALLSKLNVNEEKQFQKAEAQFIKTQEEKAKVDLSDMDEQKRMTYYCAEFFKLIDKKRYEDAYSLLYSQYKENYFPTFANFKKYFEDYFPDDFSLNYTNIERLGSIYVMWVSVNDTVNGSKFGHNFSMYVVVQENALNDYVISFSRDSAVNSTGEEG